MYHFVGGCIPFFGGTLLIAYVATSQTCLEVMFTSCKSRCYCKPACSMHIERLHVGMEVAGHEDGSHRIPVSATSHLSECCAFHCFFTRPFSPQAWFISSDQFCGKSWLSGSLGPPGLAFGMSYNHLCLTNETSRQSKLGTPLSRVW